MIDVSKLKDLVTLMSANDLAEVSIKQGEEHITIKRGVQGGGQPVYHASHAPTNHAPQHATPAAPAAPAAPVAPAGVTIDSPMVGTFYGRPNPEAKPFVSVGSKVSAGTVVCIIEAMKVFNEIKAEKDGTIDAILVKDGQAVEFGQALFSIK
ncbi:MAG TPA: acetyl-CoA carboxylase biotin carboxyl carrier protein [Phycisphaerales bacterium]|nr:acetyl-CoA carboxylase biotin carboxyl carrier protein [Phycisphaerales bacterium]